MKPTARPKTMTDPGVALPSISVRGKLPDDIVAALRHEIVTGARERGSKLPNERELAAEFGVSQPTIREAMRALDVMGLITVRHGRGAFVRGEGTFFLAAALQNFLEIEHVTFIQALDVRTALSRESSRLAATAATASDLDRLDTHLAKFADARALKTIDDVVAEAAAFQISLSAATHNPLLIALESFLTNLLLQIQLEVLRGRGARFWRERSLRFADERAQLVAAIRAHDAQRASAAMDTFLRHLRQEILNDPVLAQLRLSEAVAVDTAISIVRDTLGI